MAGKQDFEYLTPEKIARSRELARENLERLKQYAATVTPEQRIKDLKVCRAWQRHSSRDDYRAAQKPRMLDVA